MKSTLVHSRAFLKTMIFALLALIAFQPDPAIAKIYKYKDEHGKTHFTAANLSSMFHRAIEHPNTGKLLQAVFADEQYFEHHEALPAGSHFGDEGAANHNRFASQYAEPGVQLFVFGRYAFRHNTVAPAKFPSRQTYEASLAVSRLHELDPNKVVYAQQNPNIIDAGAFHNDVVSVSNLNTFFMHEEAFVDKMAMQAELQKKFGINNWHTSATSLKNEDASFFADSIASKM